MSQIYLVLSYISLGFGFILSFYVVYNFTFREESESFHNPKPGIIVSVILVLLGVLLYSLH